MINREISLSLPSSRLGSDFRSPGMLPSVSHSESQAGNDTTITFSPPRARNEEAEKLSMVAGRIPQHRWARSRSQIRPLLLSLAGIISIAAFLVMVSVCGALQNRKHFSGVTRRRLSEHGDSADDEEQSILEACVDMETELGILGQGATLQSAADPTWGVEGLFWMLRGAATDYEALQGTSSQAGLIPQSSVHIGEVSKEEQKKQASGFQTVSHTHHDEGASGPSSGSSTPPTGGDKLGGSLWLDPDAWLEGIPSIIPKEVDKPNDQVKLYIPDHSADDLYYEEPSTSAGRMRLPHQAHPLDNESHPYARIPRLARNVVVRRMDTTNVFGKYKSRMHTTRFLDLACELLRREILGQDDANALIGAIEGLVGSLWHQIQVRHRVIRPVYAVSACGIYFLAFDAITSAIQLFGKQMDVPSWWDKFIEPFRKRRTMLLPPQTRKHFAYNRRLAHQLYEALGIFFAGNRPADKDIIKLKTMLFCSPESPKFFKECRWNALRKY